MTKLKTVDIFTIALFSTLTAIGAYIYIPLPFSAVPITLQTMFTYIAGAILGGYLGALSQMIYILIGVAGLPIFAGGGSSLSVLIGPSGGYLIGFIIAAFVIGELKKIKRGGVWLFICMVIGTMIIYVLGVIQLMNWAKINLNQAIGLGVLPFIFGDLIKILLATYITQRIEKTFPNL
jgi:biotin transport system substrate-specific component